MKCFKRILAGILSVTLLLSSTKITFAMENFEMDVSEFVDESEKTQKEEASTENAKTEGGEEDKEETETEKMGQPENNIEELEKTEKKEAEITVSEGDIEKENLDSSTESEINVTETSEEFETETEGEVDDTEIIEGESETEEIIETQYIERERENISVESYGVFSSRVEENYSGYYIGAVTSFSDGLNGTVEIDHEIYEMTEYCDYSTVVKVWLESEDKTVVCKFSNGKISQIDTISEVIYPTLMTSIAKDSFVYQDGKYAEDEIELTVKIGWEVVKTSGYSEELLKEAEGAISKVSKIQMNINSEHIYFEKNNAQFLETDVSVGYGKEKVYSYDVKINQNYVPEKINNNIQIDSKIFIETGSEFDGEKSYIRVGNIDLQQNREKQSSSQTTLNKTIAKMRENINKKTAVALDSTISYYFDTKQQKEIEQYLTIWMAEVVGAQKFKAEGLSDSLQESVRKKILDKLDVSYNPYLFTNKIYATTTVEGIDRNGERQKIQFTLEIYNYTLDEESTAYASFGDIKYEVLGKKNKSDNPVTGMGMITYTDLEQFSEQVKEIANDAIESVYEEVWGTSANKVAAMFVSAPIEKLLDGKFSNNVYKLLTGSTEKYLKKNTIKCPVDVYVYDWDGNLCGAIVDNKVSEEMDKIFLSVNNDEKFVYMTEGDYVIELVGNDKGEMEVEMEEYVDGELQRKFVTSSIPLYDGRKYYEVIPSFYLDKDMAKVVDVENDKEIELTEDSMSWNGTIAETFAGGDGSGVNPYLISNVAQLAKLANDVNNGISYEGKNFLMTQDIDLNGMSWTPIGYWEAEDDYAYFKGNFDGNHYQISNMCVSETMAGLFGEIENARICNVSLENAYVTGRFAGGIAGYVESNCAIENCTFEGEVKSACECGGIAGYVETASKIYQCTNYGFIESKAGYSTPECAGGIVGCLKGSIKECNNYGTLQGTNSGGIASASYGGNIFHCKNFGNIYSKDTSGGRNSAGGIIESMDDDSIIYNCQNYGDISGEEYIGGIIALGSGLINKCSNYGKVCSDEGNAGGICASASGNTCICNSDNYGSISGNIAGGILGINRGKVMNTSNYGTIFAEKKDEDASAGGLIGYMSGGYKYTQLINSYSVGIVSGAGNIGSAVGNCESGWIEKCYYLESQNNGALGKNTSYFVDIMAIDKNNLKEQLNSWVSSKNIGFCLWNDDNMHNGYPCMDKNVLVDEQAIKEECERIITEMLTKTPTATPTEELIVIPTKIPTEEPTAIPTEKLTTIPARQPTATPTPTEVSLPKAGSLIENTSSNGKYKVTANKTVEYVQPLEKIKNVKIPATITIGNTVYKVTSISKNAFKNNKEITKVTIGSNITTIGASAFSGCSKLKTVTISKNVSIIGDRAFYKCTMLSKVTIPSKVKEIGKQAFYDCKKLKSITIKTTKLTSKNVGSKVFKGIYSKAKIKVPKSKVKVYKKLLKAKGVTSKAKIE